MQTDCPDVAGGRWQFGLVGSRSSLLQVSDVGVALFAASLKSPREGFDAFVGLAGFVAAGFGAAGFEIFRRMLAPYRRNLEPTFGVGIRGIGGIKIGAEFVGAGFFEAALFRIVAEGDGRCQGFQCAPPIVDFRNLWLRLRNVGWLRPSWPTAKGPRGRGPGYVFSSLKSSRETGHQ